MTATDLPHDAAWLQALECFMHRPSVAGWMTLLRSTRPEHRYHRSLQAVRAARLHGLDPVLLYRCLLCTGPTSCLLDLVEEGAVQRNLANTYAADMPQPSYV